MMLMMKYQLKIFHFIVICLQEIKEIGGKVFIDSEPEFNVPKVRLLFMTLTALYSCPLLSCRPFSFYIFLSSFMLLLLLNVLAVTHGLESI